MKGGRGKEEWKWVKSGGESERLPKVDRSTNGSSAKPREERREKRKGKSDG